MFATTIIAEYWPYGLTASAVFIAWGEIRAKVAQVRKDVDAKVDKDTFQQVDTRLARIEGQLDRLIERYDPTR